jgi:hypothetical protein
LRLLTNFGKAWMLVAAAATLALAAATAQAEDVIRDLSNIGYTGQITGVAPDGLIIHVTTGDSNKTIPLTSISRVKSDRAPTLEAPDATYIPLMKARAPAEMQKLEKAYKDIMVHEGTPPWLKLFCQWRLYPIYVEGKRTPEALDAFLDIAKSCPKEADTLKLPTPAAGAHDANKAMIKALEPFATAPGAQPYLAELKNLRVSLLLLEGSSNPNDILALLNVQAASKDEKVRLTARVKRVEVLVGMDKAAQAVTDIEEIYKSPLADPALTPDVIYWHGRVLEAQKKGLEAALDYMRIAILYPAVNKERTAESLFRAGQLLSDAKAPKPEIRKVWEEAATYAGTGGAQQATRALMTLGS